MSLTSNDKRNMDKWKIHGEDDMHNRNDEAYLSLRGVN
jgi:hypothetical protein